MAKAKKKAPARAAAVAAPAGGKYTRVRALVLPTLKLVEEQPAHVTITGPMTVSTASQRPDKDGKVKEPATVCPVTDLDTGEITQIICGAVLKGILNEQYPDDAYVGKSFEIVKHAKAQGKRYNTYSVFEINA